MTTSAVMPASPALGAKSASVRSISPNVVASDVGVSTLKGFARTVVCTWPASSVTTHAVKASVAAALLRGITIRFATIFSEFGIVCTRKCCRVRDFFHLPDQRTNTKASSER